MTIHMYVVHKPHLVEVEELYMNGRNTRPPRRGGRIVNGGPKHTPHLVEVEELYIGVPNTHTTS